jgi:3-methyl-2-oxobutanoate hydroxymethyltransferase
VPALRAHKVRHGKLPLVALTAYDAPTATLAVRAGIDLLLVGDSVGTTLLGYDSTVPVTLAEIVHHLAAVRRGAPGAFVIADLPFGTYQASNAQAVETAVTLVKAGADAVKLEGGASFADRLAAIANRGIPVVAHIGLTPQTATALGGYIVQGRDLATAQRLLADADAVAAAGAIAIVLEVVPAGIGTRVTQRVDIPVIGIGAGGETDGQIMVWTDVAGLTQGHVPRFVQRYAAIGEAMTEAFARFAADVRSGAYPAPEHTYATPAALDDLDGTGDR